MQEHLRRSRPRTATSRRRIVKQPSSFPSQYDLGLKVACRPSSAGGNFDSKRRYFRHIKMYSAWRATKQALSVGGRAYASASPPERKVAVLGAAGGIGQPLALLMKVRA